MLPVGSYEEFHARSQILVGPDSRGWNIHRDPGYVYVESGGLYRQDAIVRAKVLAAGFPVLVLNEKTRRFEAAP